MSRKLLALFVATATLGACTDSPVSPTPEQPAFAKADVPADLPAASPGGATIVELAAGTEFLSTLVFAVTTSDAECGTNFGAVLSGKGQYTVFAPTDDAFATLIGELGAETVLSCDVLPTVLAYHVTRGRHVSGNVLARPAFRMLSGETAEVEGATIAGAPLNLDYLDISGSNGVVHVVDAVLLPPSITGS